MAGEYATDLGQVLVQLHHLLGAAMQHVGKCGEVLDGAEDIVTVITERRECLREFDDALTNMGALPT
ncbi:hypothetical protein MALGJ_46110 [Mycolicibacter algericus]|uniref:Uncharacterized protein n=1 Tax=Mycolicibacter algericus TaxID=1288388 RepID=A0A7I9YGW5_MYCAL|nr:hypothetical protein MALGJ_46110 [Mycolicibacter algericus]